ncbi:MAG: hypothetical protein AB7N54_20225 [Alphaproteobacteria bacterium]
MLNYELMAFLLKIESEYGTNPTPTGADNTMLVENFQLTPLQADQLDRTTLRTYGGAALAKLAGKHVAVAFDVPLAGSGAAGTAPAWGVAIRVCGFDETVVESTSVTYALVDSGFESATGAFFIDGIQHLLTGMRGNATFRFNAHGIPYMRVEALALYTGPTAVALPTQDFSDFVAELTVEDDNTPTFTFASHAGVMESLELSAGVPVQYRSRINSEAVRQTAARRGSGTLRIEEPAIGTKNFWTLAGGAAQTGQLVHGASAGNIITVDWKAQILAGINRENSEGVSLLNLPLRLVPTTAGYDELVLTLT